MNIARFIETYVVISDPITIGWIKSIYGSLQFITSPIVGSASDIYGRRSILLVSILGAIVGYILLGLAGSIAMVVLSRIPCGLFKHTLDNIKLAVTDLEIQSNRAEALGKLNACTSLGFILGPALAGYLSTFPNGFRWTVTMTIVCFAINATLIYQFYHPQLDQLPVRTGNKENKPRLCVMAQRKVTEFWHAFHDPGPVRSMLFVRFLMALSAVTFRSHFILVLEAKYGSNEATQGYVLSYMGLLTSCGSFGVGQYVKWVQSEAVLILSAILLLSTSYLCIGLSNSLVGVLVALIPNAVAVRYVVGED